MGKKAGGNKKIPAAPLAVKKTEEKKQVKEYLFEKKARNYRIGGDIQPKRNLTRFVKFPQFVQLQRKKRIMLQRLKVPPALAQFTHALEKNQASQLLRILKKIKAESRAEKKDRLKQEAETKVNGGEVSKKAPAVVKFGLNHVVSLVEEQQAKLVIIAHDVDPIELVAFLPALCRKKNVPYCILKGKSRLGQLCGKKTASCLAVTKCASEDTSDFNKFCESMTAAYNDNIEMRRSWGGHIMGNKSQHVIKKRQQLLDRENAKKTGLTM